MRTIFALTALFATLPCIHAKPTKPLDWTVSFCTDINCAGEMEDGVGDSVPTQGCINLDPGNDKPLISAKGEGDIGKPGRFIIAVFDQVNCGSHDERYVMEIQYNGQYQSFFYEAQPGWKSYSVIQVPN